MSVARCCESTRSCLRNIQKLTCRCTSKFENDKCGHSLVRNNFQGQDTDSFFTMAQEDAIRDLVIRIDHSFFRDCKLSAEEKGASKEQPEPGLCSEAAEHNGSRTRMTMLNLL